jgi:EmrB/QacA subfamily drug resistance transporter
VSFVANPCDRGVAASSANSEAAQPCRNGTLVLVGTVLGSSLAFVDGSAVNLALPVIAQTFGGGAAAAQWVMNAYLLMLGALVLAGGAAGDRYGRRKVFLIGVGLFCAASVLCGLAANLTLLIAARALQGFGAALLVPSSLAILGASFDKAARGRAVGIWAGAAGLTGAIGPALGGWLTQAISWRAVFLINLPIAAVAVIAILAGARESRTPQAGPLDWPGALAATLGLGAFTWGLTEAPAHGLSDPRVLAGLAVGVVALAGFFRIEQRAPSPMMPLALFRSQTFSGANGLTFLLYAAFGGAMFLLPFDLMRARGYDAAHAGAALLPLSAGLAVLSPVAGRLTALVGARVLLTVGPLIVACGFALLAATSTQTDYWTGLFPSLALLALGMGIAVAPLTDTILEAVGDAFQGAASGVNNAVARVAGLLAVALAGFALGEGATGEQVAAGYRIAMIAAAGCAAGAALIAVLTIRPPKPD